MALLLAGGACGAAPPEAVGLELVEVRPLEAAPGEQISHLLFEAEDAQAVEAVLRRPIGSEVVGGVVLVAGRETGREAAALIPGPLEAAVLAIEYPEDIPAVLAPGEALRDLQRIRRTAERMPGVLLGGTDYLVSLESIDPDRILMVGVSFGVPFAAAAGRDERYAGVALHHGGARLRLLFRENLPGPFWRRDLLARLAAFYFRELEPARHVPHIAPRPLLLINGLYDGMIPRESVEALRKSAEGAVRQIWLPHDHLMPGDRHVMRELADSTVSHFSEIVYGETDASEGS